VATLLQIHAEESNRSRIMSLFDLINRGLGPIGSFSFGLVATAAGVLWTAVSCGILNALSVAYVTLSPSPLGEAKSVDEA
jgi:hypothetical protein